MQDAFCPLPWCWALCCLCLPWLVGAPAIMYERPIGSRMVGWSRKSFPRLESVSSSAPPQLSKDVGVLVLNSAHLATDAVRIGSYFIVTLAPPFSRHFPWPRLHPHRSPLCDCASSCSEAPADPEAVLCCPQQVLERQWTQVIKPGVHSCFSRHPLLRRLHLSTDPMIDWFFFCVFSAFQQCRALRKMWRYKITSNKWPTVYFYVC